MKVQRKRLENKELKINIIRSGAAISVLIIMLFTLFAFPMPINAQNVVGTDTGLRGDDYGANNFPIGFTFNYWGVDCTTFGVSTNGWISLQNPAAGTPYTNSDFPMSGSLDGMIAPFFDDIRTDVSGQPEGRIFYLTIGDEPNRQLIVQFHDMYFYGSDLPMGTFEVILHEGTNQISFQYRYLRDETSLGNSATIGMDKAGSDEYIRYSFNTSSLTEQQAIAFAPDGQGGYIMDENAPYSWVDISGLTNLSPEDGGEYTASDNITFTWEPTAGANAYRIDIATAANESAIIASFPLGNVTSYTYSDNLVEGTTYYARVAASLNSGGTYQNPSLFSDGITIDQTPPVVDQPLGVQGTEASIAEFHFSGTDNYVIAYYHIQIASDALFTNLLTDTTIGSEVYSYQSSVGQILYVRAYAIDGAGNQSDYSAPAGPFEIPLPVNVADLSRGLVAYYPFNGNANDQSGNGNHGIVHGAALTEGTGGNPNSGYQFSNADGLATSYIEISDISSLRSASGLTVSTWVKSYTMNSDRPHHVVAKEYGTSYYDSFVLVLSQNNWGFSVCDENNHPGTGATASNLNEWQHIVGVWDGSNIRLYINGEQMSGGLFSGPIAYDDNPIFIGADDNDGSGIPEQGWNGVIDEVRIYDRALNEAEIQLLYEQGGSVFNITQPDNGTLFADSEITVRGNAASGAIVEVFVNGVSQGTKIASSTGYFSLSGVQLSRGGNVITVSYHGVKNTTSEPVTVVLYPKPSPPQGLSAIPGDTEVTISWEPDTESTIIGGYNIYRDGVRLNDTLLAAPTFTENRLSNGKVYTYAVTAVDAFGYEGEKTSSISVVPVASQQWNTH